MPTGLVRLQGAPGYSPHGVCWCMFCSSKGAKTLATFEVVRCGNVRSLATLHTSTTLFNLNGVQGVAGSNPAVPINCFSSNDLRRLRSPFVIQGVFATHTPVAEWFMFMFNKDLSRSFRESYTAPRHGWCMWCMSWCMIRAIFRRVLSRDRISSRLTSGT